MNPNAARGITFIDADIDGARTSLRIAGARIVSVGAAPRPHDRVVDLRGDRLLPGLINAHDHLQFNTFPRTRFRDLYRNVAEWIEDVTSLRGSDPGLVRATAAKYDARVLVGWLKNLLSGVTTVAHHDAWHPALADHPPIHVLRNHGWSHSLGVSGDVEVKRCFRETRPDWPWIVHCAEGIDAAAAHEFERLESLGCIADNTVLVHGLGMTRAQVMRLVAARGAVVWCPASNLFLFGRTLDPRELLSAGRLALGSDSRISGANDLLDELRAAVHVHPRCEPQLESLVTRHNARLLRIAGRGLLVPGAFADLIVLPAGLPLTRARRADLAMVMVEGRMRYGDARIARALGVRSALAPVGIDGHDKLLDRTFATRLHATGLSEPGVDLRAVKECAA